MDPDLQLPEEILPVGEPEALANDLRVTWEKGGGFNFVRLYDADDHDTFLLGEDEIKALHAYLGRLIKEKQL